VRWRKTSTTALGQAEPLTLGFLVGTKVYVRDRYLGNWCSGFVVAEVLDDGYRLRRLTDGLIFPDLFAFDDVHLERRQSPRTDDGRHPERPQFP
jgi:hypothetical protein